MTCRLEEFHLAIADRSFRYAGPGARPARVIHDSVASAVYGGLRRAGGATARAGGAAAARRSLPGAPALGDSPRGALALAALNGILGSDLEADESALALEMTLRHGGRDVSVTELAQLLPETTPKVAVFVHGLCESEHSWRLFREANGGQTYASRLRDDLGYTPVHVRCNTGLHVSDNGSRLAALLEAVVEDWPVEISEIALIGHSMGGLISRSACHQGYVRGDRWVARVRHVFCLGTPHMGAPAEKAVNAAGWALGKLGETRPIARILEMRSAGIKDLRYGSLVEDDWRDCEPDALLDDRCTDVPLLAGANHYVISAAIGPEKGPLGRMLGDLLVRQASASGHHKKRRIAFEMGNGHHLPGLNHFQLLNHPAVYEQMRNWLERGPPARAALPSPV